MDAHDGVIFFNSNLRHIRSSIGLKYVEMFWVFFFLIIITLNVVYLWCGDSITHTIFNIYYYKFTAGTVIFCFTSYINP